MLDARPRESRGELGEAVGRRDQDPRAAVREDVPHLQRLEDVVDRDEDATRCGRGEHRDDGLEALLQIDGHTIARLQAEAQKLGRLASGTLPHLRIRDEVLLVGERQRVGSLRSRSGEEVNGTRRGSLGPPLDEVPVELLDIVGIHICAPLRVG